MILNPHHYVPGLLASAFAVISSPSTFAAQPPPVTEGLLVNLDASSITGLANGGTVTNWPDSAVGLLPEDVAQNAVIAQGAGAPKYIAASPLFGGKPAVRFSAADALGYAGTLGLNPAEGAQAFTVFIVGTNRKSSISPGFSFGDIKNNVADGKEGASVKCDLSTTQSGLRFNDGNRLFGGSFESNRARVGLFRMGVGHTYGTAAFHSDNRAVIQSAATNPTRTINLADEGYHVGAGLVGVSGGLTEFADGDIAEILFYNRELSEIETNQVGLHLSRKYALDTAYVDTPTPGNRPNVVLILMDDTGWSDLGCYGGEARTLAIDGLAAQGLRFRNFHNTSRCSTTRAAMITGAYTHQVVQNPGASLPDLRTDNNITIPELLRSNGYRTYMAGKWHLGTDSGERTIDRGFQHVFGFGPYASGAGADYWDASAYNFVSSGNEIAKRNYPAGTFYQSDAIGDYSLDFLNHHFAKNDGSKFFLYLPFNPPHFDLQAPAAVADTYMDIYGQGWDVVRQNRYNRMRANGVITSAYPSAPFGDTPYNSNPAYQPVPAWDTLDADRKADLTRKMALYAAMIEKVDENIGRVIERLRQQGELDNTLVMLMADNGGNAEGGVFGMAFGQNNHPPLTGAQLANMGQAGAGDRVWLGGGWANVNNVPFRYYKRYSHEGGIRTPMIVHWPAGVTAPGRWSEQNGHVMDVMSTVADATGASIPAVYGGHSVVPQEGMSLLPAFRNEADTPRQIGYEHESTRAWVDGNWKLVTKTFSSTDGSSPANALELYDLSTDPTELNNLAASQPQKVKAMVEGWNAWAKRVGVPKERMLDLVAATPAEIPGTLFADNFNRAASTDADSSAQGMSGERIPPMGQGNSYFEGYEGSGSADSIQIADGRLQLAVGLGMSETGLRHNFIGQDIIDAGGFSVEMTVTALNSDATETANRYCGFGVGLTAAEAALGGEIAQAASFRGRAGGPVGKADFFVELDLDGNVKVWSKGLLLETVPVGATTGTITAKFALNGFSTTSSVEVTVFFNGKLLDLNATNPDSFTRTFSWENENANHIGLSARAIVYASIDNLAIRKLPLAGGLSMIHALGAGLDSASAAPGADPDGDGRPNFLEWAIGSNPNVADAGVQPVTLLAISPGTNRFQFETPRLENHAASDVKYTVLVSSDLENWTPASATPISAPASVTGNPGYETVSLELPAESVAGNSALFVMIAVSEGRWGPEPE